MKKIGIACDPYKVEKFKTELEKGGYTDYEVTHNAEIQPGVFLSVIRVEVPDNEVKAIAKICQMVELHFKRGN